MFFSNSCSSSLENDFCEKDRKLGQKTFRRSFNNHWFHHVCAHTWLGPHDCAQTRLCSDMFVPTHVCEQTWLCPETLVPKHGLWRDTIMFLDNYNIFIVYKIMCQLDWWKHKHAHCSTVVGETKWNVLFINYCSVITMQYSSWNISWFYYNMSGHKICLWAQACPGTNVHVFAQTWICSHNNYYNMSGHRFVWAQTCLGTIVCGHKPVCEHKRVWAQTCVAQSCVGTIVWAKSFGLKYQWAQTCGLQ